MWKVLALYINFSKQTVYLQMFTSPVFFSNNFHSKLLYFQNDWKYIWFFFEANSGLKLPVRIYNVLLKEVAKLFLHLSVSAFCFPMSTFYEVCLRKSVSLLSFREG